MPSLKGKVALVTGAGSGIGRGIAKRYVAEGASVAAIDISRDRVESLKSELGAQVLPICTDTSLWAQNAEAVVATIRAFGGLDIFVGNAGIYDQGASLESMSGEQLSPAFDELFGTNVKGYLLGVRAALPELLKRRGCVILTASFASFSPSGGGALYTASKHAVVGLVRQLAYELAPDVRVNAVAPGVAPTALRGLTALDQSPQNSLLEGTEKTLPLQSMPTADSYAGLYAFLASDVDAAHITGSVFSADSGLAVRGLARPGGRARL